MLVTAEETHQVATFRQRAAPKTTVALPYAGMYER